ncbi:hypothetical protein LZ32DRAFT_606727 [Colletotrichum eremochloae]|uniref:Uncharacterized protein n=1 Tax=Colletotrichum sublineola TaxID=1173701 RepID=A0A066XPH0_COLSU|nr:hypothetical protein LZ32DRAFT_606727 [Colletotrichum eremochloae]KDN67895.1 hypothetical protein CSUB01_08102 [Colletotrichum sublineola]
MGKSRRRAFDMDNVDLLIEVSLRIRTDMPLKIILIEAAGLLESVHTPQEAPPGCYFSASAVASRLVDGIWQRPSSLLCGACGSDSLVPLVPPKGGRLGVGDSTAARSQAASSWTLHPQQQARSVGGAFGWSPAWLQTSAVIEAVLRFPR